MEAAGGQPDSQEAEILDKPSDRTIGRQGSTSNSETGDELCRPEVKEKQNEEDGDVFSDSLTAPSLVKPQKLTPNANGSVSSTRALSASSHVSMTPDGQRRPRRSVTFAPGIGSTSRSSSGFSLREHLREAGSPEIGRSRALSVVNNANMELLPESIKHFKDMENLKKEDKKALVTDVVISTVFVTLYIISVILNLAISVHYHGNHFQWFLVILLLTIIPSVITQIASYMLGSRDEHSNDDTITILHLLQLGVISRYSRLVWKGMKGNRNTVITQSELLSAVSLFHSLLSLGPQLIIQLFLMAEFHDTTPILLITVCIQSMTFAYSLAFHRLELRAEIVMKLTRLLAMFLWRFLIISSRVVAIAMFMNEYGVWIILILTIQVIIFVVVHMIDARIKHGWLNSVDFLQSIMLSYIHLFCFFNHLEGQTRYRYILYYGCIFMENTMLILIWFARNANEWYGPLALCVVWIGFGLGIICMVLYYHFLHHSKWESRTIDATPDLRHQRRFQTQQKEQGRHAEEQQRKETIL